MSAWGAPVSPGYQRTQLAMELFFWLKRMNGCLAPLHAIHRHKSRKQRPRLVPAKLTAALSANAEVVGDDTVMSAAFALQSGEGVGGQAARTAWSQSMKVITERDSSDSETELKMRVKEENNALVIDKNPSKSLFHWTGFGHDNDVVRLGRFGRLRSSWDKPRRRRVGYEVIPDKNSGNPTGRPIAPDYSSSDDSCTGLVDDQKKYRLKPRITRKLIKKQKDRVVEVRRAMRASRGAETSRKKDREGEVLSSLYGHNLGPLESPFGMPKLRMDWPGSPLDLYEEKKVAAVGSPSNAGEGLEERLEMSLGSAQKLGVREECWTHMTDKKGRVRGMEPRMDHDPMSKVPLGFMGLGTDLSGAEYQLVGIDNNEFWRRMGDNKVMHSNLHGFEDLLKGWYVVVDLEYCRCW